MAGRRVAGWCLVAALALAACGGSAAGNDAADPTDAAQPPTTLAPVTTAPFVEGTLPPTVAPARPAATTAEATPASTRPTAVAPALVPIAVALRAGGDPARYEAWPTVGTYSGAKDLSLVAAKPENSPPCVGVREANAPTARHDACMDAADGHAVVVVGDRLVVLALRTSIADLRVVTDKGTVTAPLLRTGLRTAEGTELRGTAVVVPSGTDVIGVDEASFPACPYRALFATGILRDAFTIGRCTPTAAVGGRGTTSEVAQGDSAYFLVVDGTWTSVGAGGDPCSSSDPGSIDLSNRTPEERTKLEAELAVLRKACVLLGEVPG